MDYSIVIVTGNNGAGKTSWLNKVLQPNDDGYYTSNDEYLKNYRFYEKNIFMILNCNDDDIINSPNVKFVIYLTGPNGDNPDHEGEIRNRVSKQSRLFKLKNKVDVLDENTIMRWNAMSVVNDYNTMIPLKLIKCF